MRVWTVLATIGLLTLAGCSEAPVEPESDVPFDDIEVGEGLGLIRGVVVDEAVHPVAGADVSLRGGGSNQSTKSDDEGRFVFKDLLPGTYFVSVRSPLHTESQTGVEVVAGDAPPVTKIQVERLFSADPYTVQIKQAGFFQCSQAGAGLYSSSNCAYDPYRWLFGPGDSPTQPVDNLTQQEREWHSDVGAGWKTQVFEMTWEPSAAGTSQWLGIVVSTYKPEREGTHWFAEAEGPQPFLLRIDEGVQHPSASGVEPAMIPSEGMQDMSYFVSVKQDSWPVPALAVDQEFNVYLTQFYYLDAPEGWSFLAGDTPPF